MSLDGLGGMAMAEAYTARKFHRENMKTLTASTSTTVGGGTEDNGGGYSLWFFGKRSTKKNSAKFQSSWRRHIARATSGLYELGPTSLFRLLRCN
ncbi:BnaC08g20160D [Brassica napus]|uniref:(rape) hypothetical protein n=1 Tax=Brassica napus TaxID=3708 RepID=A0A078HLR9_BRANA|nr:unnamed protein product [Brassica napus]CDY38842.1 BnaC08g20160D [Brassica napus]